MQAVDFTITPEHHSIFQYPLGCLVLLIHARAAISSPRGVDKGGFRILVSFEFSPWKPRLATSSPTPTCPQPNCSVRQVLSNLTIHFMYFNLCRTFIWLKFPFQGLECAFHTQAEMICWNFVSRSLVYKDSN